MKTILLLVFTVYALIAGILYFRMKNKQSNVLIVNAEWVVAQIIKFIVFMFWGWLLYPIALVKQRIIKKAIENNDQETLNRFLD